jgi:hypothetical protein
VRDDELLWRMDSALERSSQALELNARAFEQLVSSHDRLVRAQARVDRTLDDLRDQIAANTQALLRLIDRLGPAPNGP